MTNKQHSQNITCVACGILPPREKLEEIQRYDKAEGFRKKLGDVIKVTAWRCIENTERKQSEAAS